MLKAIKKFVNTMVPVLLGVYLAIWAGNCNTERQDRRELENFTSSLRAEIESNAKKVARSERYHSEIRDSVESYLAKYSAEELIAKPASFVFGFWRGAQVARLRQGIYNAGLSSGTLTQMPLDSTSLIIELYRQIDNYRDIGITYVAQGVSMSHSKTNSYDALLFMSFFLADMRYSEGELLRMMRARTLGVETE